MAAGERIMMRRSCRTFQPLLVEYADGELDTPGRQRLEDHLAECPRCCTDLAALREVPSLLRTSSVPDPGDAFWLHQRHAIGRAIRNLPEPRAAGWLERLRATFAMPSLRYPIAVAVSLAVALAVYRLAARPPMSQPAASTEQVAQLDNQSLAALHDLMQAVVPTDESLSQGSADDETLLAALPLNELVGVTILPEAPRAADLEESELEGIGDLIGDLG
jgi:anti-sigma factor RsiW